MQKVAMISGASRGIGAAIAKALAAAGADVAITYEKSGSGCTMELDWETTRASVDISAK